MQRLLTGEELEKVLRNELRLHFLGKQTQVVRGHPAASGAVDGIADAGCTTVGGRVSRSTVYKRNGGLLCNCR